MDSGVNWGANNSGNVPVSFSIWTAPLHATATAALKPISISRCRFKRKVRTTAVVTARVPASSSIWTAPCTVVRSGLQSG
ncbi:hypothetical protein LINPERHAP2_LOCUS35615 [Linum perenne]